MNNNIDSLGLSELAKEKKSGSNDTTGLFVSLYLIVLAFFVVMNSISNQEQNKVNAATESVTRAFKNPFEQEAVFIDVTANVTAETPNDEFYDQIKGVFASLVGFDGRFPTKGGNVVKIKFFAADLFREESSEFRPEQQAFLQQLSTFLSGGRQSEKREIDIVISSGKNLPEGPEYWKDTNILRAGAFVQQLIKLGVVENKLSIGLVKGDEDLIALTFTTRERINATQSLTGHDFKKQPANTNGPKTRQELMKDLIKSEGGTL